MATRMFARGQGVCNLKRDTTHGACAIFTDSLHGEPHLNDAPAPLHDDRELFSALIEAVPNLLMVFDLSGALLRVNLPFQVISAYTLDAYNLQFSNLFQDLEAHEHWRAVTSAPKAATLKYSSFLTTRVGRRIPLQLDMVRVGEAATARIVVSGTDLRSQRAVERKLWRQAYFEQLTRLPNRAGFKQQLGFRMVGDFQQDGDFLAVAVLDVTRFRSINDVLGYAGGDALLQSLALRLKVSFPEAVIGNFGAGEFALLFADVRDEREALDAGQRVLELFRDAFMIRGQRIVLDVRIGVTLAASESDPESVIRDADSALFEAKESGGHAVRVFDRSMRLASEVRMRMDSELRLALVRQEFYLALQPIVRLKDASLVGFEALLRWTHPSDGEKLPLQFIAHAERSGIMPALDAWAIRAALDWLESTPGPLICNVNASAYSLMDPQWLSKAIELLHTHAKVAGRLRLEITESALLGDAQAAANALDRLIAAGTQIVLDDFGTGYSSLVHLQRFPISGIKVDRSFVARLDSNVRDQKIVAAMMRLAADLGLSVTAEGVETQAQRTCLLQHGCEFAQGYLFGRPVPAAAAVAVAANTATTTGALR